MYSPKTIEEKEKEIITDFARRLDNNMKDMLIVYLASNMMARDIPQSRAFIQDWADTNKRQQKEFFDNKYEKMSEAERKRSFSKDRSLELWNMSVDMGKEEWLDVLGLSSSLIIN